MERERARERETERERERGEKIVKERKKPERKEGTQKAAVLITL